MNINHRPLTLEERFFKKPIIVGIPNNLPNVQLPAPAQPLVIATPPTVTDLMLPKINTSPSKTFPSKELAVLLGIIVVTGVLLWVKPFTPKKKQRKKGINYP